jgi:putative endonuclease
MRHDRRKEDGLSGEGLALGYLFARGLRMVARNWRSGRYGELDLVCRQGATIVFVEVKTRRQSRFGPGAAAVDARKQRRLLALGTAYMRAHPDQRCRFDVVEVDLSAAVPRIRHFIAAFP